MTQTSVSPVTRAGISPSPANQTQSTALVLVVVMAVVVVVPFVVIDRPFWPLAAVVGCGGLFVLLRLSIYRQMLLFVFVSHLLVLFLKLTIGIVPSQLSALLPVLMIAVIYVTFILHATSYARRPIRVTVGSLLVLCFALISLLQVFNPNSTLGFGLRGFQRTAFYVGLFFVAQYVFVTTERVSTLVKVLAITGGLGGAYSIVQQMFGLSLEAAYQSHVAMRAGEETVAMLGMRDISTLGSPFAFGLFSGIAFLAAMQWFRLARGKESVVALVIAVFNAAGCVLAGSRSVYLGIALGLAVTLMFWFGWPLLLRARLPRQALAALGGMLSVAVLATLILWLAADTPMIANATRRLESVSPNAIVSGQILQDRNVVSRFAVWSEIVDVIAERPIAGYGVGVLGGGSYRDGVSARGHEVADNQYLELAGELGVLGVLLYVGILLHGTVHCLKRWHSRTSRAVAHLGIGVLVLFVVAGIGAPPLDAFPANAFFWIVLGVVANLRRIDSARGSPSEVSR